jgi:hypothetical protein
MDLTLATRYIGTLLPQFSARADVQAPKRDSAIPDLATLCEVAYRQISTNHDAYCLYICIVIRTDGMTHGTWKQRWELQFDPIPGKSLFQTFKYVPCASQDKLKPPFFFL